jgi:hypothetical protein
MDYNVQTMDRRLDTPELQRIGKEFKRPRGKNLELLKYIFPYH